MAADQGMAGVAGQRLLGIFALSAAGGAIVAFAGGESMAGAVLAGIGAGLLLPLIAGIVLLVLLYLAEMIASIIGGVVLLVWISIDWRNRQRIAGHVQETEQRWAEAMANGIVTALRWLVGKAP